MRILVTGSSGTIGTRLCEKLLERGHDVLGLDRRPNKWQESVDAKTLRIDLLEDAALEKIPAGIEAVVHLAANARVYDLVEEPLLARENFITTFNILEWARRNKVGRFLFASSREAYGNARHERYTEDLVRLEHCESPYSASKVGGEALVHAYRRCYGLQTIIFRFSNVYGMYDESNRVIPLFIRRALAGETLTVFGKDKCLDFTYIDDAVQGIMLALEKFDAAKDDTYNIAYGEGVTLVHLAERVKELLRSRSEIVLGENRTGEVIRYVADIAKAKKMLGYKPITPFEEGIRKTVEWYQSFFSS
jgi:UDP-glucose 4-epimerase